MASSPYKVQPGDSLRSIAAKFYGNGNLWSHVYNANTDVVSNPQKLVPGQTLYIPGARTGKVIE